MKKKWFVSLCAGNAPSKTGFHDYVDFTYDDDGNTVRSQFMIDFKMRSVWNDQTRESEFSKPAKSISSLLGKFSYGEQILARFREIAGSRLNDKCNALLLLYNYKYNGKMEQVTQPFRFQFYGVVPYQHQKLDIAALDRLAEIYGTDEEDDE